MMPTSRSDGTESPLSSRTILIVEDTPSVRAVLQAALVEAGAITWLAEDGEAAMRLLQSETPDLILLDLLMPRMDGWAVIERLRQSPRTARIPVILETSAEDYSSFDRARRDGVAAFISKPFRLNEVVETCRRVFEGGRPLQGTRPSAGPSRVASVLSRDGSPLSQGDLVDMDSQGAQVELPSPLPLGEMIVLALETAPPSRQLAEVRWVTRVEQRYCVGFLFHKTR
jgi:two-component system chemotaxis response regulator CheY